MSYPISRAALADLLDETLDHTPAVAPALVVRGRSIPMSEVDVVDLVGRGQLILIAREHVERIVELLRPVDGRKSRTPKGTRRR